MAGGSRILTCLVCIAVLLGGLTMVAHADVITIRVGVYDNAPKIYTNTDGTVSGFWPDLVRQLAAEEGWEIEWVAGSWSQCLERLEAGTIDLLPDTGWTEPRSRQYAFTQETVLTSWSRLYVPQGSDIESIIDLKDKTVAALRGSFNLDGPEGMKEIAQAFDLDVTFVELDSYERVFEALEKREVDAGVTNKDFGNQHENAYAVERTPIIFQPARMQFALPKDAALTPYLIGRIDVHMKAFKQDENSVYYQALEQHTGSRAVTSFVEIVPTWARTALLILGGIVLFLAAVGIVSRLQVRHSTSELRESEAQFRIITEHSADAIFITDQAGHYSYVNQAASDLLGYSKEELVGMSILDVTRRDGADQTRQSHAMIQQHGHQYVDEIALRKRDGSFVSVDLNAVVLPNGSVYGSCRDITERVRVRDRILQESAELVAINKIGLAVGANVGLDAVFTTIYEQVGSLMDTPDFRIRLYDPETETIQSVFKIVRGQRQEIGQKRPLGHGRSDYIIRTGKPLILRNMTSEKYRELDIITTKPDLSYVGVPMTASGEILGTLSVRNSDRENALDEKHSAILTAMASQAAASIENARLYERAQQEIADRVDAEQTAKNRVHEWQSTFDSVTDAICLLDSEQTIVRTNRAMDDLFAAKTGEMNGKRCWGLVHHTEEPIDGCPFVRMRRTLKRESMILPLGDLIFEVTVDPMLDESGVLIGAVHLMRDITQRVRAEEETLTMMAQLRQVQKLESIGTLASGVAHEINNPLMGMMNYAELVKDRVQDPKATEYLEEIGIEGNRIAKIVRNLLSFSRQDAEHQSPAKISDIIDNSLTLVGSVLRKDQIRIDVDVPEDIPQLKCRSQQIQQVMVNLLTNAHAALNARYREYDDDKVIRVTARPFEQDGKHWIRTTVEDHGSGISKDVEERIFDPFFTTKPRHEGTGLGLSVSFGIVKEHHGHLTVESVPGEITRFHMDLPVDDS